MTHKFSYSRVVLIIIIAIVVQQVINPFICECKENIDNKPMEFRWNQIVQEDLAAHLESVISNYDRYDANRLMRPQRPIDLSSLCGRSTVNPTQKAPTASAKEFPWQAFLLIKFPPNSNRTASYCGGALIDYQWILTSARCVDKASRVSVVLGAHDLSSVYDKSRADNDGVNIQSYVSDRYFLHPEWNRETFEADLALIRLPSNITTSSYIRPICLPKSDFDEEEEEDPDAVISLTGWGTSNFEAGRPSNFGPGLLRKMSTTLVLQDECRKIYGNIVTQDKICNRVDPKQQDNSQNGTTSACIGDRGGPLGLRGENGRWVLIGVASFFASVGCQPAYPDGFTRVSYYTDWISSTIANNNNNDDQYSLVGDLKPWTEKPANILIKQTNSIKVENIDNDNRITPKPTGISYFFNKGIYNWRKSTSGLLFQTMTSPTPNQPTFKAITKVPTKLPGGGNCPYGNFYANPNACHTFNMCSRGYVYLYGCPGGLVFDPINTVCDYPENVPSCNNNNKSNSKKNKQK